MARKYTKQDAISVVTACAKKYHDELEGNTLLFICEDKHHNTIPFEFSFKSENFMHLTGLKPVYRLIPPDESNGNGSAIRAADFYNRCLNRRLSPDDFKFSEDGTTDLKLGVLPFIISKNLSAKMIGDYGGTKPHLYTEKLAGGAKACMGFIKHAETEEYVPNTVLQEDIRNHVTNYVKVIAAYRKPRTAAIYEELTYAAKGVDWSKVKYPAPFDYIPVPTNS